MIFHINIESNPGSVGRLGAGLIHASLLKFQKFNGIKVQIVKEPTLLFEKSQLNLTRSKIYNEQNKRVYVKFIFMTILFEFGKTHKKLVLL